MHMVKRINCDAERVLGVSQMLLVLPGQVLLSVQVAVVSLVQDSAQVLGYHPVIVLELTLSRKDDFV